MLTDVLIRQVAGDVFRGFEPQRWDHVTVGASYEILFTGPIKGDFWGGWHLVYGPKSQFSENIALGRVGHRLIGAKDARVCGVVVEG
jgi:hypothetical protein